MTIVRALHEIHHDDTARTPLDIGAIFRTYGESFRARYSLSHQQAKVMRAIERCRTKALGGHLYKCTHDACDYVLPAYNSCRDRHCPKCQGRAQFEWLNDRKERLLNTSYFHVVFTLPSELRSVARSNQKVIYDLLMSSAARTLLDLGKDPKRLGGLLGITEILHTWSRSLAYHPHVHCIVTGGGLAPEGGRWVDTGKDYLFPVNVMGSLFRGKFLAGLKKAHATKQIELGTDTSFEKLLDDLYGVSWVVYAKRPFGGPAQVFEYIGRYTHRVGIANSRLRSVDDDGITFDTKGGKTATLEPVEFIRRFLQHVLPSGFVKIRHFGLHASAHAKTKLAEAQRLLGGIPKVDDEICEEESIAVETEAIRELRTGQEVLCPRCGIGYLLPVSLATGPP